MNDIKTKNWENFSKSPIFFGNNYYFNERKKQRLTVKSQRAWVASIKKVKIKKII